MNGLGQVACRSVEFPVTISIEVSMPGSSSTGTDLLGREESSRDVDARISDIKPPTGSRPPSALKRATDSRSQPRVIFTWTILGCLLYDRYH